jgi:hypothetical protein
MQARLFKAPYDDLPLLPFLIADAVCGEVYTGSETSLQVRDGALVAKTEFKRRKMTRAQVDAFCEECDKRCRDAYAADAEWFLKCLDGETSGRDQLYVWTRHWLAAFLRKGMAA